MSRLHFAHVLFVLLLIVGSTTMLQAQAPCTQPCQAPSSSAGATYGAWEAYVYAGGTTHGGDFFNDTFTAGNTVFNTNSRMPGAFTWGGKVGGFVTQNFSIDGNLSWYNHFALSNQSNVFVFRPITNTIAGIAAITGNDIKSRALLWEASFNYDFTGHTFGGRAWAPYATVGIGGITARIKNADQVFLTGGGFIMNPLYVTDKSPVPQFIANPAPVRILDNNDTFLTFSYGGGFKALRLAGPAGFRVDVRGRTIPNFFGESTTRAEFTGGLVFNWGER